MRAASVPVHSTTAPARGWRRLWEGWKRIAMVTWLTDKLWVQSLIEERLGVAGDRILLSEHHLSHAASAFLCSPYDEAAILTVHGVGEWATATYGNDLRLLKEIRFPHSLGLLYSAFTAFLGFEVNEGEYKVMGMRTSPAFADAQESHSWRTSGS